MHGTIYQVRHNPLQDVLVSDVLGYDLHHLKHLQLGRSKLVGQTESEVRERGEGGWREKGMEEEGDGGREARREGEGQRKVTGTCAALMCAVMDARTMISTSDRYAHEEHTNIRT